MVPSGSTAAMTLSAQSWATAMLATASISSVVRMTTCSKIVGAVQELMSSAGFTRLKLFESLSANESPSRVV
jgi:hypothetical protein